MLQDYIEQLGSVAEFMPSRMKENYQYICIENLLLLETHDRQTKRYILKTALLSRFQLSKQHTVSDTLLEDYLDPLIIELNHSQQTLLNSTEKLREQLKSHSDTKSMDAFLRSLQAYRKIRAALDLPASQSLAQFQQAEQLLHSSLAINDFDYMAHFQQGWLYLWILDDIHKAQQAFNQAVQQSTTTDPVFSHFANRYLAFSHFMHTDYQSALHITQTLMQSTYASSILLYESMHYALHAKQVDYISQHFSALSEQHALYYVLLQTEPLFQNNPQLQELPEKIRRDKLYQLHKSFDKRWEKCPARLIQMEEGCNVNRVYLRTLKHYLPELEHVPFVDLAQQGKQLETTIFQVTRSNIAAEIDKRHQLYDKEISEKQQRYAWIHRTGKFLFSAALYIIVTLLVLGIYLVLDRYFIPGDSGITVNNWMIALSSMIFVLIIGFIGTIFETKAVYALFNKQKLVNDALKRLHKKPQP